MRQRRNLLPCILFLLILSVAAAQAADDEGRNQAKLEKLPPSPLLLKPPEGVEGDFTVAAEAPSLEFALFPNQWEGARLWSAWGDSVWAEGKFYAAIGDHDTPHGTAYVYRTDPGTGLVDLIVDFGRATGAVKGRYAPGKIHAPICDGGDGWLYIAGYYGSSRGTTKDVGFQGDHLLRYSIESGKFEDLGILVPDGSIPEMIEHRGRKMLYGLVAPGKTMAEPHAPFYAYDYGERKLVFHGGPQTRMRRSVIVSRDGRAWYESDGKLVYFDPDTRKITKTDARVPGNGRLREASRPAADGTVYCFSQDGVVFAFDPKRQAVRTIAKAFVTGRLYTTSCELGPSDRYLYYLPSAHGGSSAHGSALIQLDVKTGKRKVIAFLNAYLRREKNYNVGGTYGLALSADGSQLFINCNGAPPQLKRHEFGLCAALIVNIPEGERRVPK